MSQNSNSGVQVGAWIALGAAVALTAKGEFDLAIVVHYPKLLAPLFPVMLDVYVAVAFHRKRWGDVIAGLTLMLICQIAVHLLPVFITEGEQVPWGLVVAVVCVPPIVAFRTHALTGKSRTEQEAEAEEARRAEELRKARAAAADADRKRAEAERALRAEQANRAEAERRADEEAAARRKAEEDAAAETEARKAEALEAEAEIARIAGQAEQAAAHYRSALDEAKHDAAVATAEAERLRAANERLSRRAEGPTRNGTAGSGRKPVEAARPQRKALVAVPPEFADGVPHVEGVTPELVAAVLSARKAEPGATRLRLAELAGTSDRTVRKVLNSVPQDVASRNDSADDKEGSTDELVYATA